MKLSDLKWWHWTLATMAIAVIIRVATGGPLPFVDSSRPAAPAAPAAPSGKPHREPNTGPSLLNAVTASGLVIEGALPELNRLTIEASVPNPGKPPLLVDQSGTLIREIARALQAGVSEDSDVITTVRVLVATKGRDRTGKEQAHLPLYALDFKAVDLFALKPDQTPTPAALGLATSIVFNGADAHAAVKQWCAIPDNLAQAHRFCGMAATVKGV